MDDKTENKTFKYRQQLTKIAHREQISFEIDLDDVQSFDEELAASVANNTRRYTNLVLDVRMMLLTRKHCYIQSCSLYENLAHRDEITQIALLQII